MRGQAHSDETQAAVMAALLAGQSISQVAAEFKLGKATVSKWYHSLSSNTSNGKTLEDLLLDYVATNLKTLKAQSEIAGRPDYIQKQPASELAVLHGVIADKTVRILAAFQPVPEPENDYLT